MIGEESRVVHGLWEPKRDKRVCEDTGEIFGLPEGSQTDRSAPFSSRIHGSPSANIFMFIIQACVQDRNFASAQDILSAFDSDSDVMELKKTLKLAGIEKQLAKFRKMLLLRSPLSRPSVDDDGALYSYGKWNLLMF